MKNGSLEHIIGEMAARLDVVRSPKSCHKKDDPLDEIGQFVHADPVLASLHKQYLEANAHHKKLVCENGFDDPMAEVAADMLDSARSAVHTRLLELQEVRFEQERAEIERTIRARKAGAEVQHACALIAKREKDKDGDLFFWLVVFYWLMNRTLFAARKRLSAANDFAQVSQEAQKRGVYAS